jgi:hypothetical protein
MANAAITPIRSGPPLGSDGDIPVQYIDFDARGFGRRFPQTDAPEGWVKKVNRRAGKVWVGYFHLWTTDAQSRRVRTKKEKTLGSGSLPKHEAQQKLADYISEYTGKLTKQGDSISTFTELWKAFWPACNRRLGKCLGHGARPMHAQNDE